MAWIERRPTRPITRTKLRLTALERRETPAAFTPGNLVILRTGGSATSAADSTAYNTTAPIFLDEYTPDTRAGTSGLTLVRTVSIPTVASVGLTNNRPAVADLTNGPNVGQLNLSYDGSTLLFGGVDSAINNSKTNKTADRVIVEVGVDPSATGGINSITHGQFDIGDDLRAVAKFDSATYYTAGHPGTGTVGGTRYFNGLTTTATPGLSVSKNTNTRGAIIGFDGRLYSTTAGPASIISTAEPRPTATPGVDLTVLMHSGSNTEKISGLYLADMNSNGIVDTGDRFLYTGVAEGLYSSAYDSTASTPGWQPATLLANVPNGAAGLSGITGAVTDSTHIQIYLTSYAKTTTSQSKVYGFYLTANSPTNTTFDNGSLTELLSVTSAQLQGYRGVAYSPTAPTSVTLTASKANAAPNETVTFTATLASLNGAATGSVNFIDNDTTVVGTATIDPTGHASLGLNLPSGSHRIKAYYAGMSVSVIAGASGTLPLLVTGTAADTTVLTASPTPSTGGQSVTFTAAVTGAAGTASGSVAFADGTVSLGSATLTSGIATISVSTLSVGSHTITASYSGSSVYLPSSATAVQAVHAPASITLTSSATTQQPGVPFTFNAAVVGNGTDAAPIGSVLFLADGAAIASAVPLDGTGHATLSAAGFAAGSRVITAVYSGDTTYVNATSNRKIATVRQAFGAGNLVVERVGDGSVTLSNAANPIYLDEYTPAGSLVQSIALPTETVGIQRTVTMSGVASTQGALTLSGDGHYLAFVGFDAPLGTPALTSTPASTLARVVGRIDNGGTIDTSTALFSPTGDTLNNIRGAVTQNGSQFWIGSDAGATTNTGILYATLGTVGTATPIGPAGGSSVTTGRVPEIYQGQLYISTNDKGGPIEQVGTGLPTTSATLTTLPGLTTSTDPYAYLFLDHTGGNGPADLLYIADQTNGLLKFSWDGSTWNPQGVKFDFAGGFTGLTGSVNGSGNPVLYATGNKNSKGGTGNNLVTFTDTEAYNAPIALGNVTELANATTIGVGAGFRGIAFAPTPAPLSAPHVANVVINGGDAQRSKVTSIAVTFDNAVSLPTNLASAFTLTRVGGGSVGAFTATTSTVNGSTQVLLTGFSGAESSLGGSLGNGRFTLTVLSSAVSANGLALDGDNDGSAGGNATSTLTRLYGDSDGNRSVDAQDVTAFLNTYGTSNGNAAFRSYLDSDGNGSVDAQDVTAFLNTYGVTIP